MLRLQCCRHQDGSLKARGGTSMRDSRWVSSPAAASSIRNAAAPAAWCQNGVSPTPGMSGFCWCVTFRSVA